MPPYVLRRFPRATVFLDALFTCCFPLRLRVGAELLRVSIKFSSSSSSFVTQRSFMRLPLECLAKVDPAYRMQPVVERTQRMGC